MLRAPGAAGADSGPAGGIADLHHLLRRGPHGRGGRGAAVGPAVVRTASGPEIVDTTIVGSVVAGDLVLVHAGTAIAVLEEAGDDE